MTGRDDTLKAIAGRLKSVQETGDHITASTCYACDVDYLLRTIKRLKRPDTPPKTVGPGFATFWAAYPKKLAKGDAEKAWGQVNADAMADEILQSLEKHKSWKDWTKERGKFIPYPATWLRAKAWENQIDDAGDTDFRQAYNPFEGQQVF